ncbi:permease [Dethiosulfovibrio peptidovorans DSM 11002]|uniref:Permease n=1 Tax=Dethiosulfovibrio peptidovorans DSM 11002 TaxID=469381 RepID=D2Z6B8_9BACT|nr:permease [Dethiosulfovibrio peptidovorans]EFC91015.1 permease [Dethiosulfovibrio peptidovorans DSM 11002]
MNDKSKFTWILAVFALAYWLPIESPGVRSGAVEALAMLHEYAQEHVLLCLVPAFFIAGAISVFVSQQAVMKYLGAQAKKWVAYSVAAVSGTILAVCSCTVLPLFAGIYKRGAGLGPATAFLYSGPAINVLSIILTARVLGFKLGLARALGAVVFSVLIGICMAFIFRGEEEERQKGFAQLPDDGSERALWKTVWHMASMVVFLVFANWAAPKVPGGVWESIYSVKWYVAAAAFLSTLGSTFLWFKKDDRQEWMDSTFGYSLQVLPLLFGGVLVAGFLLGRPGHEALIPSQWVASLVGGNSIGANFFAAISGAFMYFATLTEVPILQGLLGSGMGQGPALALLLAGPALSLPNMLVIRSVIGTKKTVVYVSLVVVMSTVIGILFGYVA